VRHISQQAGSRSWSLQKSFPHNNCTDSQNIENSLHSIESLIDSRDVTLCGNLSC